MIIEEEEKDKINIENNKEELQKTRKKNELSDDDSEKSKKYNDNIFNKRKK